MPIHIVSDVPDRSHRLRIASNATRWAAWGTGIALVTAGFIGAVMLTLYCGGGIFDVFEGQVTWSEFRRAAPLLVLAAAATVVCWKLGLRLIRGRRRLVLFLRRFGFTGATEALSHALDGTVGTAWRVVTLDDAEVAPMGVTKGAHRLARAGGGLALAAVAAACAMYVGVLNPFHTDTSDESLVTTTSTVIGEGLLTATLIVRVAALLLVLAMCTVVAYLVIRRSEQARSLQISTRRDITLITLAVARLTRAIISPRLVVVRVDGSIWQEVIRRFSSLSSVVVIDVSEPSENLLWEVDALREMRSRWLLVGERHRLLRQAAAVPEECAPVQQRLLALLDGETVLAYTDDDADRRRFAHALRAGFERIAAKQVTPSESV